MTADTTGKVPGAKHTCDWSPSAGEPIPVPAQSDEDKIRDLIYASGYSAGLVDAADFVEDKTRGELGEMALAIRSMKLKKRPGWEGAPETAAPIPDDDRMVKISKLIADLQDIFKRWGDTCVYIRRGGLSWGAVALNRQSDDEKHGVFDLQSQHDRDMAERLGQVDRLKADRDEQRTLREASEASAKVLEDALNKANQRIAELEGKQVA